jgi:chemotaxis protein CheX
VASEHSWLQKGKEAEKREDYAEASKHFLHAYADDPKNPAVVTCLGIACHKQGRLDDAARYLKESLSLDPNQTDATQILEEIQPETESSPPAGELRPFRAAIVKCLYPDYRAIHSALEDVGEVAIVRPEDLAKTDPPPDIIFVGWGIDCEDWRDDEEEQRLRRATSTAMLLTKIRRTLAFRDIPVLVVAEKADLLDAGDIGASGVLALPLERERVRDWVAVSLRPAGRETRLDVNVVNPFVEATVYVLESMAHVKVKRRDLLLKRDYHVFGEVTAILGITGDEIEGSAGITFHVDLAREIVARMTEKDVQDISPSEIRDVLGELVNVLSGQATSSLEKATGINCLLSIPTIVTGFGHEISHRSGTPCLVIIFEALDKPFAVQIAVGHK